MEKDNFKQCPVKVAVKIRPLLKNESTNVIKHLEEEPQVLFVQEKRNIFAFDHIFTSSVKQSEVYNETVKPFVQKVIQGFNCTVLAYGQTGTGKTYTMGTDLQRYDNDSGLTSRVLEDFFEYSENNDTQISISFIEIYNEKVYDLLSTDKSSLNVTGFKIQNAIRVVVNDTVEAYHWLYIGSGTRHTGHTAINNNSSRSHAVFTVYFTKESETMSKFHLVDLAGSESVRRTGTEGKAFREGITINKGLLTVGRVINALSNNDKVIPYRDSMLTTILQDSLNIKNYVVLVACVSPSIDDMNETLATLRFAETTKTLKSRPQLESIAAEFEKSHPEIPEKKIFSHTPFKRNMNPTFASSTKKKRKVKNTFMHLQTSDSNKYKISNFENDLLSISTSTVIEPVPLSLSPVVAQSTEIQQSSMMQRINNIMKTHIAAMKTPCIGNETITENILLKNLENKIIGIVRKELIQLTTERRKPLTEEYNSTNITTTPRFLNFDSDISPVTNSDQENPTIKSPQFKMPTLIKRKPAKELMRQSERLTLLTTPVHAKSPINFLSQRKSMRLSMKRLLTPSVLPTPAPRNKKNVPSKTLPTPAPRKFDTEVNASPKDTKKNRKKVKDSPRSAHLEYVLNTLNTGTLKELQLLQSVGLKTAVLIRTFRNIHGHFNDFQELKKIQWRGSGFKRFMLANHII